MSVYLSIAPPDGFTRWEDADWDRWLREHPWEVAERVCSRGDWAIFLYQLRQHADRGRKLIEPLLEASSRGGSSGKSTVRVRRRPSIGPRTASTASRRTDVKPSGSRRSSS